MKILRLLPIALLAILLPALSRATDLKISCTPSTTYEDKTAIPTTAVSTFSLWGALQGQPKVKLVSNASLCAFTRPNVAVGTQEYYIVQTTNAVDSVPSTLVSYVVAPPVPGAPTNVTVTVTITVSP